VDYLNSSACVIPAMGKSGRPHRALVPVRLSSIRADFCALNII